MRQDRLSVRQPPADVATGAGSNRRNGSGRRRGTLGRASGAPPPLDAPVSSRLRSRPGASSSRRARRASRGASSCSTSPACSRWSSSILYLSQFRAGLIDARVQSLLVQGEIIAGAIAGSATVETDTITIDPDKLLELQTGESYGPIDESLSALEFPINPERVAPLLRRLVLPTRTQARIYDREGALLLDTRNLYGRGDVLRFDLHPGRTTGRAAWSAPGSRSRTGSGACNLPLYQRSRARQRQGLSGGRAGAQRPEIEHGARQRARRDHRAGRGADPALPRGARRAAALHRRAARSTRRSRPSGLQVADAVPRARRRDGAALDAARAHHRGPGAPARRRRRERTAAHQVARRDPRLHLPARRDRRALRRAARDDQLALQPHRGDRELRGGRGARAEEPAHLAALGGRDHAARQDAGKPRAAARRDRARREAARPADLRCFRREPARCRVAAPGRRAGRSRRGCSTRS